MINSIMFNTDFRYIDRQTKGRYVWEKYRAVLEHCEGIVDIGADKCALTPYIPEKVHYLSLGYGEYTTIYHNLESIPWPCGDRSFNVVLCLDVLEHLEHIHAAFDECCRISSEYIIISLPNPYSDFMNFLYKGKYMGRSKDMKFYGLPPEPEDDRHRWFYSPTDAREFIEYRAEKNGYSILQYDFMGGGDKMHNEHPLKIFFRKDLCIDDMEIGTMWWICKRNTSEF
jgi:hypothetical protein